MYMLTMLCHMYIYAAAVEDVPNVTVNLLHVASVTLPLSDQARPP